MNQYDAFLLYHSIRLHFNQIKYDYFKYHGKLKTLMLPIKHEPIFIKLAKKYSNQLLDFYVANMLNTPRIWVNELLSEETDDVFLDFTRKKESLTYIFKSDIMFLVSEFEDLNSSIKVKGDFPPLLKLVFQGKIQLESLIILNSYLDFFIYWDSAIKDNIIWDPFKFKCDKFERFLSFDKDKMYQVLLNCGHLSSISTKNNKDIT